MDEEALSVTKLCSVCMKQGKVNKIWAFQMNLEEGVLLCENQKCPYPLLSSDQFEVVQRGYEDIPTNDEEYEQHKKSFIAFLQNLKKQKSELNNDGANALKKNENEHTLCQELDVININLKKPDLSDQNFNLQDLEKFLDDVCSTQGLVDQNNDVKDIKDTAITKIGECKYDFSNLQSEQYSDEINSATNQETYYTIMNIPIEILPEVPAENASEFTPDNIVSVVPPTNDLEISFVKDLQKITITITGMQDGSSFQPTIISRDLPNFKGRGYGYTHYRTRGSRRMSVVPREITDTDTTELHVDEKQFENYFDDPDYGRAKIPRGQSQRRRRSRGSRGSRGRGLGNVGAESNIEIAEDGTPLLVPIVKKRRGRPSYKNLSYDRSHYNPLLILHEGAPKEKVEQGQFLHQPKCIDDIVEEDELPCPANVVTELATVTDSEAEVAEKAMSQVLLADPHSPLPEECKKSETQTEPKETKNPTMNNAAPAIQRESFLHATVSKTAQTDSMKTVSKDDAAIKTIDNETIHTKTSKPPKRSRCKAPVTPLIISTRSTRSTKQKGEITS